MGLTFPKLGSYGIPRCAETIVASDDKGYESDHCRKINMESRSLFSVKILQFNKVFTKFKRCSKGVKSGEYYAAIVILKTLARK